MFPGAEQWAGPAGCHAAMKLDSLESLSHLYPYSNGITWPDCGRSREDYFPVTFYCRLLDPRRFGYALGLLGLGRRAANERLKRQLA